MENKEQMMSLYDYLGKAAGPELGTAVWQAAKKAKIKADGKEVSTKTYSGRIIMYPKSFLDEYFTNKINNLPF